MGKKASGNRDGSSKRKNSPRSSQHPAKSPFKVTKDPVVQGHELASEPPVPPLESPGTPLSEAIDFDPLAYEELGPLPATYGSSTLYLIARDPKWLFCYWDIDWEEHPNHYHGKVALKIYNADGLEIYHAWITPEARDWYIPLTETAEPETPSFYAELGYLSAEGVWELIARSNEAAPLCERISEEIHDEFATVPFHLAFQRAVDLLQSSIQEGELLVSTLARLQTESRSLILGLGRAPQWTPEQRRLLAALLGNELSHLETLAPEEIDSLLREQLRARLNSEQASLSSLTQDLAGATDSFDLSTALSSFGSLASLSSAFRGLEALSSWENLSSWETLTSWAEQTLSSSSFWSSWLTSWSPKQEELSSALALSSWLSSWEHGASSSWEKGIEASQAYWNLASWSSGLGGSSGLTSGSFGSSWSAQPFGKTSSRDFFMHVNAEVIFYGGTHPAATLWINGEEVPLGPDGTFRYHFTFPDGGASIPIVAQSPDGLERRSATLHFDRATLRRGHVGATEQPAHLSAPIGRR